MSVAKHWPVLVVAGSVVSLPAGILLTLWTNEPGWLVLCLIFFLAFLL